MPGYDATRIATAQLNYREGDIEMNDCKAKVYVETVEVDEENTVRTTFLVIARDCRDSRGEFDYVITYEIANGSSKTKFVGGSWPRQNTSEPIAALEEYDLASDEKLLSVEAVEDATRCICFNS